MIRILSVVCLVLLTSCQRFSFFQPKEPALPAFDPETWGTRALISVLHDPQRSVEDAQKAAKALADRRMGEEDGRYLMEAAMQHPSEEVKLEILTTIGARGLRYLYPILMAFVAEAASPPIAVRALDAGVALASGDPELYQDLSRLLLTAEKPEVRVRAGMQLTKRFPFESEPVFIEALEDEVSASVAAMMTEYLALKGTRKSLPVLEDVSNDIQRVYLEDDFLGKTFTAESVRGGAVKAVQRLRGE